MFARLKAQTVEHKRGAMSSKVGSLPAPVGGWNTRDPRDALKPNEASTMDNLIPGTGSVSLRRGTTALVSGISGGVQTLAPFSPPSGSDKLLAFSPTAIYEVSTGAATSLATGKTSGKWSTLNMATAAGTNFICMVNGADGYFTWDGTTFTDQSAAVTGVGWTASNMRLITQHAGRLWFAEKNALTLWYLGTSAITGAATKFPIGQLFSLGGQITFIGKWTRDGGSGPDDYFVIITTKGEVAVYSGTDPASASTWELVGVYRISDPIGLRCAVKVGGDLGALTSAGVGLVSSFIGTNKSGQGKASITNKISPTFAEAWRDHKSDFGWQLVEYPPSSLLIVNVPIVADTTFHQYVVNVETGAWARWKGIDCQCFELYRGELYGGTVGGKVLRYGGDVYTDQDVNISYEVQWSYTDFGTPQEKNFQMMRPLITGPTNYSPGYDIKIDYEDRVTAATSASVAAASGSPWDTSLWDVALWADYAQNNSRWQSIAGSGRAMALVLAGALGQPLEINRVDVMYRVGLFL